MASDWRLVCVYLVLVIVQVSLCNPNEQQGVSRDEELIQQLLDNNSELEVSESQVSSILKAIEEAAINSSSASMPEATTPVPSPFFQTPPPETGTADEEPTVREIDEVLAYLEKALKEAEAEEKEGNVNWKRSDHDPSLDKLLWGTARALWDISKPSFYKTKAGATVEVIRDTVSLPLRTFGHIRRGIQELTNPGGVKRSLGHRSGGGWGWDSDVVYVKYEPDNSLFKSWIRFIIRILRPAVTHKLRLHWKLLGLNFRFLQALIGVLRSAKAEKVRSIVGTVGHVIRGKFRPNVVVLKETGTTKGGWTETTTTSTTASPGWGSGWTWGTAPPPTPTSPPSSAYGAPDMSYGPPVETNYKDLRQYYYDSATPPPPPASSYGAPSTEHWSSSSSESKQQVELPSYANYLKTLGINPTNLDLSADKTLRSLRESEKKEDVPYLIKEAPKTSVESDKKEQ